MKKYAVIKTFKVLDMPSIAAQFDRKEDAIAFANLSKISNEKCEYVVFEQNYTTQEA